MNEGGLPRGALVVFLDEKNEAQVGSNGEIDTQEAALIFAVAKAKMELFSYRIAKAQFEQQQQGAGLLRPAPNLRVPKS